MANFFDLPSELRSRVWARHRYLRNLDRLRAAARQARINLMMRRNRAFTHYMRIFPANSLFWEGNTLMRRTPYGVRDIYTLFN